MTASTSIFDYIGRGVIADRPAAPNINSGGSAIYYATDGTPTAYIWDGSAWQALGGGGGGGSGLFNQVLSATPTAASTGLGTWLNQGGASVADVSTGVALSQTTTNDSAARYTTSVPATPYTITVLMSLLAADAGGSNNPSVGIGWTDLTKLQTLYLVAAGGSGGLYASVTEMTNSTTFNANNYVQNRFFYGPFLWLRLNDDGTNVAFSVSNDGASFLTLFSVAKASGFLGASGYSHICFSARGSSGGAGNTIGTIMSWEET